LVRFQRSAVVTVRGRLVRSLVSVAALSMPAVIQSGAPVPAERARGPAFETAALATTSPVIHPAQGSVRLLEGDWFPSTEYFFFHNTYPGAMTADPSLAVSPTRFVSATNSEVNVQVISNGPNSGDGVAEVDLHKLFGVTTTNEIVQPHVVYDPTVGRFFLSASEVDLDSTGATVASRVWLAYSADAVTWTPKPLTASSAANRYDQPIIAADGDKVVVAFTARPLGGGAGSGEITVIQKSDLVSSGVVHQVTLTGPAVPAELAPAITVTASNTLWLVAAQQSQVALVALTGTPDQANVITKNYVLPISPIVTPPAPVQPGGTIPIPPPRLVTAMWRSGTLWTTTVDGCTPPGSTVPRSCLRLVGFTAPDSAAAPTVAHEFDVGDANMDYFAPAVATNGYGDLVIAASESNTHLNPTLALLAELPPFTGITGFLYDDRSNEPYEGPDWGGYSAVAVNPTDPASVWTDAQEQIGYSYPDEPNWMTFGVEVLANTPKSWPGATPAFGTRYNQTATLIYRRADGKLEWLQSADPCPNCWDRAQAFTPAGGTNAAPALDPDLGFGFENLFTRRSTEHIWWDTALDGGAWYDLGGYATSAPTALPAAGGCALSVFVRGSNGAVYRKVKSTTSLAWGSWQSLGGALGAGTQPGAVVYGTSHQAVFMRGTNNQIYWKHSGNCGATWSRWASLGGQTYNNPAASSVKAGAIDVFVRGTNNALYTRHFNGSSWSNWANLGGSITSGPAAAIPQVQTSFTTSVPWGTQVIAVGPDQHLWTDLKPAGGTWTGWHLLYSEGSP
jgi:hypothetical protein